MIHDPRLIVLDQILLEHKAQDLIESQALAATRALLRRNAEPFVSCSPFEHFTASAFVLSQNKKEALFYYHSKIKDWIQPGGHVEESDASIFDAAQREVFEETGVEIKPLFFNQSKIFQVSIFEVPENSKTPAHKHFDIQFLVEATGDKKISEKCQWFDLNSNQLILKDRSILRGIALLNAVGIPFLEDMRN